MSENVQVYTIDFNNFDNIEISESTDSNWHILTHIIISFVWVYENKWTGRNYSVSFKLHKIVNNLYKYFVHSKKWVFIIESSEDDEKENTFDKV